MNLLLRIHSFHFESQWIYDKTELNSNVYRSPGVADETYKKHFHKVAKRKVDRLSRKFFSNLTYSKFYFILFKIKAPRVECLKFFQIHPVKDGKFVGNCKVCGEARSYGTQSKGNLLTHYQLSHPKRLSKHLEKQDNDKTKPDQCLLDLTSKTLTSYPPFLKQKSIQISISRDLCAKAGLPVTVVENEHFRAFMENVQPAFDTPCYRTNLNKNLRRITERRSIDEKRIVNHAMPIKHYA